MESWFTSPISSISSGGVRVDATFVKGERDMLGDRYVVVRGDNLWRVAGGTSPTEWCEAANSKRSQRRV